MNKYSLIVIVFFTMVLNFSLCAQSLENTNTWKLYKEVTGLQIFSKELSCHDDQNGIHQQFVIFQFVNSTSEKMNVSWQKETWYDGKCTTCDKPVTNENTYSLMLDPGESIEATCSKDSNSGLKIFSGFLNTVKGSHLSKFELKNLNVTFK